VGPEAARGSRPGVAHGPPFRGIYAPNGTITPLGDFSTGSEHTQSNGLASPLFWRKKMLEWKPRLFVLMMLLVVLSSLLGQFGWLLPINFGW